MTTIEIVAFTLTLLSAAGYLIFFYVLTKAVFFTDKIISRWLFITSVIIQLLTLSTSWSGGHLGTATIHRFIGFRLSEVLMVIAVISLHWDKWKGPLFGGSIFKRFLK